MVSNVMRQMTRMIATIAGSLTAVGQVGVLGIEVHRELDTLGIGA